MAAQLYDKIGIGYRNYRKPDPHISNEILLSLENSGTVLNVGAGTGSYEPDDRFVLAIEPSKIMIDQRSDSSAPVIQATAEQLPIRDDAFSAAMAILTVHHWQNPVLGLKELVRVARDRIVILTIDLDNSQFWLVDEYFPEIAEVDRGIFIPIDEVCAILGNAEVRPLLIPKNCSDGFLGAYWQRPEVYLDPNIREAISTFSKIKNLEAGLNRLSNDLKMGHGT